MGELAWYDRPFGERERSASRASRAYMERTGMVFMMHVNEQVGHPYPGKTAADFGKWSVSSRTTPALKVILAHMGGGICFYEFMPEIRKAFASRLLRSGRRPLSLLGRPLSLCGGVPRGQGALWLRLPLLDPERYRQRLEAPSRQGREKFLWGNGRRLFGG